MVSCTLTFINISLSRCNEAKHYCEQPEEGKRSHCYMSWSNKTGTSWRSKGEGVHSREWKENRPKDAHCRSTCASTRTRPKFYLLLSPVLLSSFRFQSLSVLKFFFFAHRHPQDIQGGVLAERFELLEQKRVRLDEGDLGGSAFLLLRRQHVQSGLPAARQWAGDASSPNR